MKLEKETVLKRLNKIYKSALCAENFSAAIKAIELCIKLLGFDKPTSLKPYLQLSSLSDNDIDLLIKDIDTQIRNSENV